jgi:SAM-dependent methyltransferase
MISRIDLPGKILDIGGSQKSGYHKLFKSNAKITTVNIDPSYGCDLVFDIQKKFPIADKEYDAVTCFNVLEHIYGFHNVFSETNRILKKDGKFVFAVPFIFNIHGSPDDYFRYTKSCLMKILQENKFTVDSFEIIGDGVFSLIFQILGGSIPTNTLRVFTKRTFVGLDRLLCRISSHYRKLRERIPIGYFVVARKVDNL